jgi:hypothetical protein
MKGEAEKEEEQKPPDCPHCPCPAGRTVRMTGTALHNARSGEAAWKRVLRDTVNGIPIDRTAVSLGMRRQAVFNMRHKALFCLEAEQEAERTLSGVLESDETYILESLKGKSCLRGIGEGRGSTGRYHARAGFPMNIYACAPPLSGAGRRIHVR